MGQFIKIDKQTIILLKYTYIIQLLFLFFMIQNKCARYWPEEGENNQYGTIKVTNISQTARTDYTLRELSATDGIEDRTIYHYHYQVFLLLC